MNHSKRVPTRLQGPQGRGLWLTHLHIQASSPASDTQETLDIHSMDECWRRPPPLPLCSGKGVIPLRKAVSGKSGAPGINMSQKPAQANSSSRNETGWGSWVLVLCMYDPGIEDPWILHPMCLTASAECPSWAARYLTSFTLRVLGREVRLSQGHRHPPTYPEWLVYVMFCLLNID